jgi:hypothetical protein
LILFSLTVAGRASHHLGILVEVDLQIGGVGFAGQAGLPVGAEPGGADVRLAAPGAGEGALVVVQAVVQLQVYELREAGLALVALERLRARVQPQVRLQVGGGAELLPALGAGVRLFTCRSKIAFLSLLFCC